MTLFSSARDSYFSYPDNADVNKDSLNPAAHLVDHLLKKIEEIRLLESRKSARLVNSDTDFSKLADVNISGNSGSGSTDSKRRVISRGSGAIAVPTRSDYVQIAG